MAIPALAALLLGVLVPDLPGRMADAMYRGSLGLLTAFRFETYPDLKNSPVDLQLHRGRLLGLTKYQLADFDLNSGDVDILMSPKIYKQNFHHKINAFSSVFRDTDGIYLGSWYGELFRYHRGRWVELISRGDTGIGRIRSIRRSGDDLYLAANGIYRFDPESAHLTDTGSPGAGPVTAFIPERVPASMARGNDIYTWKDQDNWQMTTSLPGKVTALHPLGDGRLLIGCNSGLYQFTSGEQPVQLLNEVRVTTIAVTRNGTILVGTQRQGILLLPAGDASSRIRLKGLPGDYVIDLVALESKDRIWIAFYDNGITSGPLSMLLSQAD